MTTAKYPWTAKEDAALLRLVAEQRLTHAQIGRALGGRSAQAVGGRLYRLRRGIDKYNWSAEEDAFLRDTAGYRTAADIGRTLGRAASAVHCHAETLGICWRKPKKARTHDGLTANAVARMLGVPCSKTVTRWIEQGYLAGTRRAPRTGGAYRVAYRVYPESLRVFLRDYPWLYDWRRVQDRGWRAYVETLPHEEWVGTREAGRLLYMTTESVAQAIRRGQLRAEKVGPNWVIPLSAIRAYVPPDNRLGRRPLPDTVAAQRAANIAARRSVTYTQRPETVAKAEASRRARREREAA